MTRCIWRVGLFLGVTSMGVSAGCAKRQEALPPPPPAPPAAEPQPVAVAPDTRPRGPLRLAEVGFDTPESVLHDDEQDVYLVSNIGGDPLTKDDNGFISRLSPEGRVETLKWIDSQAEGVTLNAPKGMGLFGDTLYVADIDTVRMFDRATGKPKGELKIKGATFLNDIAVADGAVYVTDSGFKEGFKPSGTDAVHVIRDGKSKALVKDKKLSAPNGLAVVVDQVWVASFGAKTLTPVSVGGDSKSATTGKGSKPGTTGTPVELPEGQLDGLIALEDGTFLVSSWASKTVYHGKPGETFKPVVTDVESPADIGYDRKRRRILIPLFQGNAVEIHDLAVTP